MLFEFLAITYGNLVVNALLFTVPASAVHKESVDDNSILRAVFNLFGILLFKHLEQE